MFIRKLYYHKTTDVVLVSYMMSGSFVMPTEDWDFKHEQALQPYINQRGQVGLFAWTEPDPEIEREFGTAHGVSVDVTVDPPQLVFDHTPPEPQPEPPNDIDEILDIIEGGADS